MINEQHVKRYCCEDISKIENYEEALNDNTQTWDCHHRAEILPCGHFEIEDLKEYGLYYNRPANELIFLTHKYHIGFHKSGRHLTPEHKERISESSKGKKLSEETKQKISEAHKGKPTPWLKGRTLSEETKQKISEARKAYWAKKKAELTNP